MGNMLMVNKLSASYDKNSPEIITDLSFGLEKGTVLNILGQNAVGKTTLIRCLVRELRNYSGEILVEGKESRNYSIKEYSRKIGVVTATFNAYQNLLVADYLLTGFTNQISPFARPKREQIENAYACLELFEKQELFNKLIGNLSSGEKQIVMIARVILQNPQMIIVDEPTANLDVKNQIAVLEQIQLLSDRGYTVIITTHNPGHALSLGGKTLLMGKNKFLFGDTIEIIAADVLSEYYGLNVEMHDIGDNKCVVFQSGDAGRMKLVL